LQDLDSILSQQIDLPSAPVIIHQLTSMMSQDDVSSHDIAQVVATDQAFTARTLKLANSPFYGFARQITTVDEAITIMGVGMLQQLLLGTSVLSSLGAKSKSLSMDDFWLHSFSVGVIAKHLLYRETIEVRNEAFMCGVLHDIGRLLFVRMDVARYERFYDAGQSAIDLDKETQWFGADHQQIGQALADKWNFPPKIATCIAHHHYPEESSDSSPMLAAIHIADLTCHALNLGKSGNEFVTHFSPETWQCLELDKETYKKRLRMAASEIRETEAMIRSFS